MVAGLPADIHFLGFLSALLACKELSRLLSLRKEWAALGNMSKQEAMTEFVKLLNRCCHLFSTYVTSHKIEKEEQEKKR